jgi:hypothetical protein
VNRITYLRLQAIILDVHFAVQQSRRCLRKTTQQAQQRFNFKKKESDPLNMCGQTIRGERPWRVLHARTDGTPPFYEDFQAWGCVFG